MTYCDASAFQHSLAEKSLEELDELLRQFYAATVLPVDKIKAVCAAIRARQNAPAPDVDESYARFIADYDHAPTPIYDDELHRDDLRREHAAGRRRVRRRVRSVLAAAVAAVLMSGLLSMTAFGQELGHSIVTWIQEVFSLPVGTGYMDFPSLEAALDHYGVEPPLAPSYVPEGFDLTTMNVSVEPGLNHFFAEYSGDHGTFTVQIEQHTDGSPFSPTIPPAAEVYIAGGVEHYLTVSSSTAACIWTDGGCQATITGNLTAEQLQVMVASIYESAE